MCTAINALTVYLLLFVLGVFDGSKVKSRVIREDESSGLEVLVAGEKNSVKHGLVEQEIAHPFGNDDIKLLDRQRNVLEFALDECDGCAPECEFEVTAWENGNGL